MTKAKPKEKATAKKSVANTNTAKCSPPSSPVKTLPDEKATAKKSSTNTSNKNVSPPPSPTKNSSKEEGPPNDSSTNTGNAPPPSPTKISSKEEGPPNDISTNTGNANGSPPTSPERKLTSPPSTPMSSLSLRPQKAKKRVVVDYAKRESSSIMYTSQVNKTESNIILITFPEDKKKKFTYMEDMENKEFLNANKITFTKNFKARDLEGKVMNKLQHIGYKSPRKATCFIHIVPDEEEYYEDEEKYLKELCGSLVANMNEHVQGRQIQYEDIVFKVPKAPFQDTITKEPLSNFLLKEDCLELFSFIYDKDIEEYSNIDKLFSDYPHIVKEFLGSDSKVNRTTLRVAHQG